MMDDEWYEARLRQDMKAVWFMTGFVIGVLIALGLNWLLS